MRQSKERKTLFALSLKKSSRDQQVLPEVREATINCREGRTKAQVLVELLFVKGAQRLGLVLVGKDGRKLRLLDARDGLNLGPGPQLIGREAERFFLISVQLGREAGRFFFLRPRSSRVGWALNKESSRCDCVQCKADVQCVFYVLITSYTILITLHITIHPKKQNVTCERLRTFANFQLLKTSAKIRQLCERVLTQI